MTANAERRPGVHARNGQVTVEGLKQLRARALEPRLRQIELALANPHADSESDPISLLKERSEIQRQLRAPLVLAAAI